jgi:hypothetical protein
MMSACEASDDIRFHGPWNAGRLAPELPMSLGLAPWGDFRLSEAGGWNADSVGSQLVMIEAQRTVTETQGIAKTVDAFGRTALDSPDRYELLDGAIRITAAISFAIGADLDPSPADLEGSSNVYIAETDSDRRLLARFGIDRARLPLAASTRVEVADHHPVDERLIAELARRGAVAVYREALRTDTQIGQFRKLWRTLEFAFQAHGTLLVELLAAFPPVVELEFDRQELEELRMLRGKISHAASRSGSAELARSRGDVIGRIGRLWCRVDRVLLTKAEASRSLVVDELRPLSAFIDRHGTVSFSPSVADPEDWLSEHGITMAGRFRQPER